MPAVSDNDILVPAILTFEQAASVPVAAFTALQALRDKGHIQPGHKVLVNRAAGGVGTFAVQIAKALGAEVTGVCSTRNLEMVRSIGADHVIDYTREDFTRTGQHYDLMVDIAGNRTLRECRRALAPKGVLVGVGGPDKGHWIGPLRRPVQMVLLSPMVSQTMAPLPSPPEQRRPRRLARASRSQEGHTGHRSGLSAQRSRRSHPLPRRRARQRKDRHHCMTRPRHIGHRATPRQPAADNRGTRTFQKPKSEMTGVCSNSKV